MPTKESILQAMRAALEPLDFVHALWLEGADAVGAADAYSDLDVWLDVDDDYETEAITAVEEALTSVGRIDYRYVMRHEHPRIRQRVYHLEGASPYLMIDCCWQLHSRDPGEYVFVRGDRVENAAVLFDKSGVVRFADEAPPPVPETIRHLLDECAYRYAQHCRVEKYLHRRQYAESCAYYHRYVIEPLVILLRLRYTPRYPDYGLIHISRHIPPDACERLENLLRVSRLEDIAVHMREARLWFDELWRQHAAT